MSRILFLLVFFTGSLYAKNFSMSLGGFARTKSSLRGALTWTNPSLMLGPSFTFFEKLSLRGPSLSYNHFSHESPYELSIGSQLLSDGEPLISLGDHEEDYRNERRSTWELQTQFRYKFGFKNKFYIGGLLAKDIDETKGLYSELHLGAPLFPFTTLGYLIGFGEAKTNQYLYGTGAKKGPSWHEFSLSYVIPFVPWNGIIINKLSYSQVLQNENKAAYFVRGSSSHLEFRTMIIWNVF